jgi:GH35 family endo-1,4-beta-xylanase
MKLPILLLGISAAATAFAADALDEAIARNRKGTIVVKAAPGTKVSVEQTRHEFWFGATLPNGVFNGRTPAGTAARFKAVFSANFNSAVVENAFKWHDMERERGVVNYETVDNALGWASAEGIPVRGHCIFWGIPNRVQEWLKVLPNAELTQALEARARMVGTRFRGKFAEYDLNNEMIHGNYYEQRLGDGITKEMALWVKAGDPDARLFLNDYDITTGRRLDDYVKHIRKLLDQGVPIAGIGVQGHLHGDTFDPEALKRSLDELAQFKLPIRITEFNMPGQRSKFYAGDRSAKMTDGEERAKAENLRQFYRIAFAHPSVTGIMMWGFWEGANWIPQSSLYTRDWIPTPALDYYRRLTRDEWWTRWSGTVDGSGMARAPVFHGKHRVTVNGKARVVDVTRENATVEVAGN